MGFEDEVRFEHHVTETAKSIVRQPYDRRDDIVAAAATVPNVSAKHEGGDPSVEALREHPSDILDYFLPKAQIERDDLMPALAAELPRQTRRREPHRRSIDARRNRRQGSGAAPRTCVCGVRRIGGARHATAAPDPTTRKGPRGKRRAGPLTA